MLEPSMRPWPARATCIGETNKMAQQARLRNHQVVLFICCAFALTTLFRQSLALKSVDHSPIKMRSGSGIVHAVYINLQTRADRREEIETELRSAQILPHRINASDGGARSFGAHNCPYSSSKCAGMLGCKLSHIKALDLALQNGWEHVAIFEDDFIWSKRISPTSVQRLMFSLQQKLVEWDVIAISLNILQSELVTPTIVLETDGVRYHAVQIYDAKATHGYIVNRHYLDVVKTVFKNCNTPEVAIDNCWRPMQKIGRWYGISPQLGSQRPGYSDIEKSNTNYSFIV